MPGKNCAFPQCTVSQYHKHAGIKLFQISTRKDEFYSKWREDMVNIIKRYRVTDRQFNERVLAGKVYICERHFVENDFEFTKTGLKALKLGVVPTMNLPVKSHEIKKVADRRHIDIVKDTLVSEEKVPLYKNISELIKRIQKLKLSGWEVNVFEEKVHCKKLVAEYLIPKYELIVYEDLQYSCIIFGWPLPNDSDIYKKYSRSVRNVTISNLLNDIHSYALCDGVDNTNSTINYIDYDSTNKLRQHLVPRQIDLDNITDGAPSQAKLYMRSTTCKILHKETDNCISCKSLKNELDKKAERRKRYLETPAKSNAPLSQTHPLRVGLALKQERKKSAQLKKEIARMKAEISSKSVAVTEDMNNDFQKIITENSQNISPFMQLFWEEQKKAAQSNGSLRYHPMIIRFCLSLAAKSASAYDELRSSNVLTLPSRRTLRDYKNAIKPSTGFNPKVIDELIKTAQHLTGYQRYVVISFDEVKIQENLVFDKYSGELIGFVDLGNPELNYTSFSDVNQLATHALVYYVRGLASDLKFSLAYFATKSVTSFQIMPTFWEAVALLEITCKLPVIAAVSDGASSNRKFYKMHDLMDNQLDSNVVYRSINLFAPEDRYLWFFADPPHLMKTTRNCIHHSGNGEKTRNLWNDGLDIAWHHFVKIVEDELNNGLKLLPRLTLDHVNLTPYSVMNVRLAAQILSRSVSKVLYNYYPVATHATAELCMYMDNFFDCLNVRNQMECIKSRKDFLAPYRSVNDYRFDWLQNDFLNYLKKWKANIEGRKGEFSASDRDKMFLSNQTYEGITITVNSVVEATRYLLQSGMPFVLTEKFNQDVLEEYFGRHRALGRRNDNPTLH